MQRYLLLSALLGASSITFAEDRSEAIYLEKCASCHGRELQGGNAQSMVDGVWQFGGGDGDLTRNIKFGISAVGMPNYEPSLSDDEINGLVRYIREAQSRAGAERPPLPETLPTRDYDVKVEKWIGEGLRLPWALTFVDQRTALLTEQPGRLRIIKDGKLDPKPIAGTPPVFSRGQGGLLDVAVDPDYATNGWVYLTHSHALDRKSEKGETASMTRLVRGKIVDHAWTDQQVLFEADPATYRYTTHHFGSRIAFDPEGRLYFSIGERGHQDDAQNPNLPNGKVHRVNRDGSIPADNPFADGVKGLPSVFTYGNRNPQGLATHPATGVIWESEHGPMGGDEINVLEGGVNYGWPKITYGLNYNGTPITDTQRAEGMRQPVSYWAPSIAVCGIEFSQGDEFPRWKDHLIVGGLGHETLQRLAIADGHVMHTEQLLQGAGRVRDVAVDPSGAIYAVLNGPAIVIRLTNGGVARRQ
ncbi:Soluble aldose sugar dehydrogenase YliI precursor [Botrimarina colliarenosi]|uniref:Soluble aldose sugar dehydrogenase YliI n=1 Tax=Botrimarina colliarenosi TaxID=2528001 RepID=A0A5C6AJD5_9BACT|nr:PQQ-dependent sugar dehydrogenase [Botrimarina colliarenosi]TWU00145.1 Soluble aldose sugar dehydrogenase YliI precursor [Botrimarina colliarenosi]